MLDPNNIRLETEHKSELEIVADLFVNEGAMDILESIYENGFFPDESPVVVKEKGKFVVVEGNRRVASLKAMRDPNITPPKFESKIREMMKSVTPLSQITVRIATGRDQISQYLAAKHTKTTRRPWSALRRAYFYYAQKENGESIVSLIRKYKGVDIPSYIKMYEMHRIASSLKGVPEGMHAEVATKNFNISTLERLYNDSYVQKRLGINFDSKTGEVRVPKDKEFDDVYSKIVVDVATKAITSRLQIKDAEDRKKYIDKLLPKPITSSGTLGATSFKPKPIPKVPRKLVPADIICTLSSPSIERVLWELQNINHRTFPNAAHDLLRSFLEAVLKKYLDRKGATPAPKRAGGYIYLDDVLAAMHAKMKAESNHEIRQVIENIQKDKDFLDHINHNPSVFSTDTKVEAQWDQMEELIRYVFK